MKFPRSALLPFALPGAIVLAATVACVLFTYLTPPTLSASSFGPSALLGAAAIFGVHTPDRAFYWIRFAASFLFLGILPAIVLAWFKIRLTDTGLRMPTWGARATFTSPLFLVALIAAPIVGAIGSRSAGLAAYYPYSRDLIAMARERGAWPVLGHFGAYFFLYYLPWEFFFRGFLLFPLLRGIDARSFPTDDSDSGSTMTAVAAIVLFQTIPSTLLHFGHPLAEVASAIPAGIVFGILAWRAKSILPGLFLHAAIGFGTDLAIILRALQDNGVP